MFISDFAIRRPVITVVSMLALVIFGLVSFVLLQTDEFPDVAVPIVVTAVPYPGASPDNVEREIIDPIEEAISGISGVKRVTSNALDSFGTIVVEFIFRYPGLGSLLWNAVDNRDLQLIQAVVLVYAIGVVVFNLLADVATILVTPRLRTGER